MCIRDRPKTLIKKANDAKVDFIFVGGSLLTNGNFEACIEDIKKSTTIPVVIFPGNSMQISLSLIHISEPTRPY